MDRFIYPDSEIEDYIRALTDPDRDVREQAIINLQETKDNRAVESLIRTLKDPDEDIRSAAINALREIGDIRAIKPMIDMFDDPEYTVADFAASSVVSFRSKSLPLLYHRLTTKGSSEHMKLLCDWSIELIKEYNKSEGN